MRASPLGEGDVTRALDATSSASTGARQLQFQLTGSADVQAAHAYFATGAESSYLPAMDATNLHAAATPGAESLGMHAAVTPGAESLGLHTAMAPGAESLAMHAAAKAGEGAAMGAGAQAISPMIQMIMRMPGHLGLMSSFFEFLGNFFLPQNLLGMLDPTHLLAQQAEAAMSSLSHMTSQLGVHLGGVGINLLPHDALLHGVTNLASSAHSSFMPGSLLHGTHDMTAHLGGAKDLTNLEAAPKEAFSNSNFADNKLASLDQSSHFNSSVNDGGLQPTTAQADTQYVAWDNSSAAFRPTLTGAQQMQMPASNAPAADPSSTMQTAQPTSSAPSTNSTSELARNSSGTSERGSLLGGRHTAGPETTSDASTTSDAGSASTAGDGATASGDMQPSSVDYTIKHGDNLWDIAHKHLGDATKWGDIYKMNQDVIGNNPSLIHEGAQLHLPGDGHLANADYVVKPGDNLWDISKSHMGGGEHWKDLYHGNEGAVGSNPDLIHPGQHLNMGHGDASGQLANSDVSAHAHHVAQPSAESAHHTVAHAPHHSVHLAHSHTPATHQLAHADHGQTVASAHPPAHSAQGQTVASSPAVGNGGEQVALKAAPAGSLAAAPGKFGQISGE